MKTVSYEVGYNSEKNEPELYITTQTDGNECYQPEWFFSTAQLNTVALSSFLSRALSLVDIPIDTIGDRRSGRAFRRYEYPWICGSGAEHSGKQSEADRDHNA